MPKYTANKRFKYGGEMRDVGGEPFEIKNPRDARTLTTLGHVSVVTKKAAAKKPKKVTKKAAGEYQTRDMKATTK